MVVIGAAFTFAIASSYSTDYIKNDYVVKRALDVIFGITALDLIVYAFITSGITLLLIMTIFNVVLFSAAFVVTVLLPKIRTKTA